MDSCCWQAVLVLPALRFLKRKLPSSPDYFHFSLEPEGRCLLSRFQDDSVAGHCGLPHSNCSNLICLVDRQHCCCYCSLQCYFMSFLHCSGPGCPELHYSEPDIFSVFSFFHRSAWLLACTKDNSSSVWATAKYISYERHERSPTSQVQLRFHNLHNKLSTCLSRHLL